MKNLVTFLFIILTLLFATGLFFYEDYMVHNPVNSNSQKINNDLVVGIEPLTVFINDFYATTLGDFIQATSHLKSGDTLTIISQGHGGDAFVCIGMINHVENLKRKGVKIITKVQSMALSANAFLWLSGDERIIHQHDLFMTHHAIPRDMVGKKIDLKDLPPDDRMVLSLLKVFLNNKLMEIIGDPSIVKEMLDDDNNWYTGFEIFQMKVATKMILN